MKKPERALSERELEQIEKRFFEGESSDADFNRMIFTLRAQRRVLSTLFEYFKSEPLRRVSVSEPVRNSELAHLKELVAMEN